MNSVYFALAMGWLVLLFITPVGAIYLLVVFALYLKFMKFTKSVKEINAESKSEPKEKVILTCTKCGGILQVTDKLCPNCGEPFDGNNVMVGVQPYKPVTPTDFDPIYSKSEKDLVAEVIKRELVKAGFDSKGRLLPKAVLVRKTILNIIFSILIFVYVSLIFFHFPVYTYAIGIIILVLFFMLTRRYNLTKYFIKELKSRPNEKISNIVMSNKENLVKDRYLIVRLMTVIFAIGLSLFIFRNPVILYEKTNGGYAVRYYAFGLSNYKTVTIPEKHKGQDVVALRGNAFSNMPYLESAVLPDTITEIRGQAFKNDTRLVSVKLPSNLKYLGGGAFYNCRSLKSISLPDTLIELGGESFYDAVSLKEVKLSENLTEIRGSTFEGCSALESIKIPDSVTRIGGHAFYGNSSLRTVTLTENSQLQTIGSSAFRRCTRLYEITIPRRTVVNSRAFKESPTQISYFELIY